MKARAEDNVCSLTVVRALCVGCGACAGVCPRSRLRIENNRLGFYVVRENDSACSSTCGICLSVCPFYDGNRNEDDIVRDLFGKAPGIKQHPNLGLYQSSHVGYCADEKRRLGSASGGIATWFLCELLRRDDVDRVACVAHAQNSSKLFDFVMCDSTADVESAARSAYYPVEMSRVIAEILRVKGRYAITCLPCYTKALRLACERVPRLKERIVCIIGLTCGHTVSSFFADYVAALADEQAGSSSQLTFRTKDPRFPASELGTECVWTSDGAEMRKSVYWSGPMGQAWSEHWFTPRPCLYCDDVFAELADISLMDAWLPECVADYRGTNIVLVRSSLASDVIQSGVESGQLVLEPCRPNQVLASQEPVVQNKTKGLAYRLWLARRNGEFCPNKRVLPQRERSLTASLKWRRELRCSAVGTSEWSNCATLSAFVAELSGRSALERLIGSIARAKMAPARLLRRLKRFIVRRAET